MLSASLPLWKRKVWTNSRCPGGGEVVRAGSRGQRGVMGRNPKWFGPGACEKGICEPVHSDLRGRAERDSWDGVRVDGGLYLWTWRGKVWGLGRSRKKVTLRVIQISGATGGRRKRRPVQKARGQRLRFVRKLRAASRVEAAIRSFRLIMQLYFTTSMEHHWCTWHF